MRHAHRTLGLSDDEYEMIIATLGREPLPVELAMYSVMWSEHCSYKSSRVHLRRLPSEGSAVLVGPGENAGVIDVGDGVAIALRMESHNHPSAIEPYQGAATGVGGILRDVFTMGARPIALMDVLCLGPLDSAHSRYIFDGVVRGIGGYGNSVGVPTVGGQLSFAPCYKDNPLVNVLCLGVLPIDRLVLSKASGAGNLVVLLGSLTGRDGIGGVSVLASAGFVPDGATKRPNVQVGDPFEEKRLIEACLDLLDLHLVVAIQDLGGAGLACATSETAARGGVGMDIDVSAVPLREAGMSPVEIMTSESQERMLAIVEPSSIDAVLASCARHDVRATVIGKVTESDGRGRLVVRDGTGPTAEIVADLPAASLTDEAPLYHRPMSPRPAAAGLAPSGAAVLGASDALLALLYDPSFVFRQYDHQLFLNTVVPPGEGDATVLRLAAPGLSWSGKGLALTCDANPAWCALSPRGGAELTVAEASLNIACAGARPVAIVDCLNFGNPEHAEVMWQLSEVVDGIAAACLAFDIPVVGGNVSLYNESNGLDIDPTPVIGLVGLIEDLSRRPPGISLGNNGAVVLLGEGSSPGDPVRLGGSRWSRELGGHGGHGDELPQLDFEAHSRLCALVTRLAAAECAGDAKVPIIGLHDVSDGGLGVCLAELCCASGRGIVITEPWTEEELFCEAPSRVVVCSDDPGGLLAAARYHGVTARVVGRVSGDRLVVPGLFEVRVDDMVAARSGRLAP